MHLFTILCILPIIFTDPKYFHGSVYKQHSIIGQHIGSGLFGQLLYVQRHIFKMFCQVKNKFFQNVSRPLPMSYAMSSCFFERKNMSYVNTL